jgi:hypothetical protein
MDIRPIPERPLLLSLGLLAAAFSAGSPAAAAVLRVPSHTYLELGPAIAGAAPGDTVLVGPGRYVGCLRIGDRVVVIATAGPDSTVLDGAGAGPVVSMDGVGPETLLEGFTITGGLLTADREDGAGIRLARGASPRLNWNRISGNRARGQQGRGGGIACLDGSNPLIANSRIEDNEAEAGGGIYVGKGGGWGSSPTVFGNVIVHNTARGPGGGVAVDPKCEPDLVENVIGWNEAHTGGGGLAIDQAQPRVSENVIWANADSAGLAGGIFLSGYAAPHIERNVIAKNKGGPGLHCDAQYQEWQDFHCNVVWANEPADFSSGCAVHPGNLNVDPGFCSPADEGFELQPGSPCLAASGCGRIGARGAGCHADRGAPPRAVPAGEGWRAIGVPPRAPGAASP